MRRAARGIHCGRCNLWSVSQPGPSMPDSLTSFGGEAHSPSQMLWGTTLPRTRKTGKPSAGLAGNCSVASLVSCWSYGPNARYKYIGIPFDAGRLIEAAPGMGTATAMAPKFLVGRNAENRSHSRSAWGGPWTVS